MITLVGKVTAKGNLDLNGKPELTINQKSGRISLSKKIVDTLNFNSETQSIGFGYDPEKTMGALAFLYVIDNVEEGVKAGKGGALTSKYHCGELNKLFTTEIGVFNRYKLDVDTEAKDLDGTKLYALSFNTTLSDITRTKKAAVESTLDPIDSDLAGEVEAPVTVAAHTESAPWTEEDMKADAEAEAEVAPETETPKFTFGAE